jgi:hypothetical protein
MRENSSAQRCRPSTNAGLSRVVSPTCYGRGNKYRAGLARPQELINAELDLSDYVLLILSDRWGSPSDTNGAVSSGTEEEFRRALNLLEAEDAFLRDIVLMFKTIAPEKMRDPGPQLNKVLAFRQDVEASKSFLFESWDSDESLQNGVEKALSKWLEPLVMPKEGKSIAWPPTAVPHSPQPSSESDYLTTAKNLHKEGLHTQAEQLFSIASKDDDPLAVQEFARFMRRTGRFNEALRLNRKILDNPELLISQESSALKFRIHALANIGIIERKHGHLPESKSHLNEAVLTARNSAPNLEDALCYSLDNLGFTERDWIGPVFVHGDVAA